MTRTVLLLLLLAAPAAAATVQTRWSVVPAVAGYRLYARVPPDGWAAGVALAPTPDATPGVLAAVTAVDVAPGATAEFAVTAYAANGSESVLSNVVSAVMPGGATPSPTPLRPTATRTVALATTTPIVLAGTFSLWAPSTTPAVLADVDTNAVELGVKFTADVSGQVLGIRYYKGPTNTGTHTGSLWSSTGARLATATFANETASGWQHVLFAAPVTITAGTVYVASYHTNVGRYAYTAQYFALGAYDNPPLHAPGGANGVYRYGTSSGFPTQTWQSTNYFVDVVFRTGVTPPPAAPTATALATATRTASRTPVPSTATAAPTLVPCDNFDVNRDGAVNAIDEWLMNQVVGGYLQCAR